MAKILACQNPINNCFVLTSISLMLSYFRALKLCCIVHFDLSRYRFPHLHLPQQLRVSLFSAPFRGPCHPQRWRRGQNVRHGKSSRSYLISQNGVHVRQQGCWRKSFMKPHNTFCLYRRLCFRVSKEDPPLNFFFFPPHSSSLRCARRISYVIAVMFIYHFP